MLLVCLGNLASYKEIAFLQKKVHLTIAITIYAFDRTMYACTVMSLIE